LSYPLESALFQWQQGAARLREARNYAGGRAPVEPDPRAA
jgi:hypothetical protein